MKSVTSTTAAVAAAMVIGSLSAYADDTAGTAAAPSAAHLPRILGKAAVPLVRVIAFTNAQYGTAGGALRNRGAAAFNMSGVVTPVQGAYLYWAVLFSGSAPAPILSHITLNRLLPGSEEVKLIGTLVAIAGDPCWGSSGSAIYRADVPLSLATGNGTYRVTIPTTTGADTSGADPWAVPVTFPAYEGASLVIVGSGSSIVNIFDPSTTPSGLGVTFISTTLSYTETLLGTPSGGPVLFDTFGADGQVGASRAETASVTGETTYINNSPISGPGIGAPNSDSDWNGNSGAPLPQLWDDHGHNISEVSLGSPPALSVSIKSFGDCLTTVANVVQF